MVVTYCRNVLVFLVSCSCQFIISQSSTSSFNDLSGHHLWFLKVGHLITAHLPILNSLLLWIMISFPFFQADWTNDAAKKVCVNSPTASLDQTIIYSTTHCSLQIDLALLDNEKGLTKKTSDNMSYLHSVFIHWPLQYSLNSWPCENRKTTWRWSEFSNYNSWIYLQSILPCTSDKIAFLTSSFIGLIIV